MTIYTYIFLALCSFCARHHFTLDAQLRDAQTIYKYGIVHNARCLSWGFCESIVMFEFGILFRSYEAPISILYVSEKRQLD